MGNGNRSVATQGVWGERSPLPHRGCHEVTGGKKEGIFRSDLERKIVAWVVGREIVDGRGWSSLRLRSVIRLRGLRVVLRSLTGRLRCRCGLSRRSDSPDTHIVVPTPVIFPGPQVESHLDRVSDLIFVQIRDLVIPERRQAHVSRIVAVLIFKNEILFCPGAFRPLSALLGKFLFDPAFYFQCHDILCLVKIKPARRAGAKQACSRCLWQ